MECGTQRGGRPYARYIASYGADAAARDPGLDPVEIGDDGVPSDGGTYVLDGEAPLDYWTEAGSEPASDPEAELRLDTEAEQGARWPQLHQTRQVPQVLEVRQVRHARLARHVRQVRRSKTRAKCARCAGYARCAACVRCVTCARCAPRAEFARCASVCGSTHRTICRHPHHP